MGGASILSRPDGAAHGLGSASDALLLHASLLGSQGRAGLSTDLGMAGGAAKEGVEAGQGRLEVAGPVAVHVRREDELSSSVDAIFVELVETPTHVIAQAFGLVHAKVEDDLRGHLVDVLSSRSSGAYGLNVHVSTEDAVAGALEEDFAFVCHGDLGYSTGIGEKF